MPPTVRVLLDGVARGAGDGGDDGALGAEQRIEQARFADVGPPDQRHAQPLAQHAPLVGAREQPLDLVARLADQRRQLGWVGRRHLVFGEVDAGLDAHQRARRGVARPLDTRREVAAELPQRQPASRVGLRR